MSRLPTLGALLLLALGAASCADDDGARPSATPSSTAAASPSPAPGVSLPLIVDSSEVYLQDPDGGDPTLIGTFPPYARLVWSPSGDLAVVSRWGSTLSKIDFLRPPDWKGQTVSVEGDVDQVHWSPDGERMVFRRSTDKEMAIVVAGRDGSMLKDLLTAGEGASISVVDWLSPTALLVAQVSGRLAEINAVTGELREISDVAVQAEWIIQPALSPDGSQIAAPAGGTGVCAVSIIAVSSGAASEVTTENCGVTALAWSPDGTRLSFSVIRPPLDSSSGVFVLDLTGGTPAQVIADRFVTEIRWSPDGGTLFASAAPCWNCDAIARTWLAVSAAGGPVREIAIGTSTALSPDTGTLALAQDEAVSVLGTIDQGQSAELWPADNDWQISGIAWKPGGSTLAIARSHTLGTRGYAATLDGSTFDRLTSADTSHATFTSPNRSQVAAIKYAAGAAGGGVLYIQSLDGSARVVTELTGVSTVKWAPDGSKLVSDASRPDSQAGRSYFIVGADGSILLDLGTRDAYFLVQTAVWSPDGTKLAFGGDRLNIADTTMGRVIQAKGPALSPRAISWTADSSRAVFMNAGEIYSVAADGGDLQQLTSEEAGKTSPALSPDGRSLVYRRGSGVQMNDEVVLHDLETGDLTTVFDAPLDGAGPDEPVAWSPDGEHVAFFAAAASGWGIYLANADGSGLTHWAYTATVTELYWLDADTLVFTTELQGL